MKKIILLISTLLLTCTMCFAVPAAEKEMEKEIGLTPWFCVKSKGSSIVTGEAVFDTVDNEIMIELTLGGSAEYTYSDVKKTGSGKYTVDAKRGRKNVTLEFEFDDNSFSMKEVHGKTYYFSQKLMEDIYGSDAMDALNNYSDSVNDLMNVFDF